MSHGTQTGDGALSLSILVVLAAGTLLAAFVIPQLAQAATPLESTSELVDLCDYGAPEIETDDAEVRDSYHDRRRSAIYNLYETSLPTLDEEVVRFDRISGLMILSGFRGYRPRSGAPAIRFRNECIVSFELEDEEAAHDIKARLRMGTVQVRIGYMLVARQDYDIDYCPDDDDDHSRELKVDLLYARLIDTEESETSDRAVIDTYKTEEGHRWALRQSTRLVDAVRMAQPEVTTSHFQWRPRGKSWQDDFGDHKTPAGLEEQQPEIEGALERALYPCYVRALSKNASLQGALVLEVPYGEQRGEMRFLMDTIRSSGLRYCIETRIAEVEELDHIDPGAIDAFKATMLLRRR